MKLSKTLRKFDSAISELFKNDYDLIERKLSERSIAHKLGVYLTKRFKNFHVDCEYNGDIENKNGFRKNLRLDTEEMKSLAVRKINELETYSVFPDIIIHTRKKNDNNHLVIEVKKKDNNSKEKEFDILKLQAFTKQYGYRLGIYLELKTGKDCEVSEVKYFQDGKEVEKTKLKELK